MTTRRANSKEMVGAGLQAVAGAPVGEGFMEMLLTASKGVDPEPAVGAEEADFPVAYRWYDLSRHDRLISFLPLRSESMREAPDSARGSGF